MNKTSSNKQSSEPQKHQDVPSSGFLCFMTRPTRHPDQSSSRQACQQAASPFGTTSGGAHSTPTPHRDTATRPSPLSLLPSQPLTPPSGGSPPHKPSLPAKGRPEMAAGGPRCGCGRPLAARPRPARLSAGPEPLRGAEAPPVGNREGS